MRWMAAALPPACCRAAAPAPPSLRARQLPAGWSGRLPRRRRQGLRQGSSSAHGARFGETWGQMWRVSGVEWARGLGWQVHKLINTALAVLTYPVVTGAVLAE